MADGGDELGQPAGAVGGAGRGEAERVRDGGLAMEPTRRGPHPTGELGQGASSLRPAPGGEARRLLEKDLGSSAGERPGRNSQRLRPCECGSPVENICTQNPDTRVRNNVDDWSIFCMNLGRNFCIGK
jgi:hypothetical protein